MQIYSLLSAGLCKIVRRLERQLTGVRIAFESVCPGGVVDIEQVLISILESQEETGPVSAPNRERLKT